MFERIEYKLDGINFCPLFISCYKEYLIRICPGPDSNELSFGWTNVLLNKISDLDVNYNMNKYDISSCDGDVIIKDREYNVIPKEIFDIIKKISTRVAVIGLKPVVNYHIASAEIYFSTETDRSMCISLDIRDQHIEDITVDLDLCTKFGIITVTKPNEPLEANAYTDTIETILTIINTYLSKTY